jgi:hypothetical protein
VSAVTKAEDVTTSRMGGGGAGPYLHPGICLVASNVDNVPSVASTWGPLRSAGAPIILNTNFFLFASFSDWISFF